MKFIKLDINDCLLSGKIPNFNEGVEYYIDGEMITQAVNSLTIRIAYSIRHRYNKYYSRRGYALYTPNEQNFKENEVYTYLFLGVIEDNCIVLSREIKKLELEIKAVSANLCNLKKDSLTESMVKLENELSYKQYKYSPLSNISVGSDYFNNNTDKYFLFNNELYYCDTLKERYRYTQEQLELLLKEFIYKENAKFTKLKKQIEIFEKISTETENTRKREPISEEVKFEVWRRDEGKCVICGSRENLEFDHIIPFSKGGGNTTRNIQLLCESCNRKKSDTI